MQARKVIPAVSAIAAAVAVGLGTAVVHADVEPQIIGGHEATGATDGPAIRVTSAGVPKLVGGVSRSWGDYCGMKPVVFTSQPEFRPWVFEVIRSSAPPIGGGKTAPVYTTPGERPR